MSTPIIPMTDQRAVAAQRSGKARITRRVALVALPLAAFLFTGCSAAQPEPKAADTGNQEEFQSWMVKYAECMQGEGLDYPTPSADPTSASETIDIDAMGGMEIFEAADKTCMKKVGEPPAPLGPDGKEMSEEDMMEEMLKLTTCLREQGVDVPDPTPGGGISIPIDAPESAFEACGMAGVPAGE